MLEKLQAYGSSNNNNIEGSNTTHTSPKRAENNILNIRKKLDTALKEKLNKNIQQINKFVKLLNAIKKLELKFPQDEISLIS